ncbi:SOUL heme-binding protein [Roseiarcus fermentans]|uniref:SOUL heme-binding protein n=1 Tax=Roseiarcus fermentans TaxID=1473586 RepID=A0A366FB44_9HYPH|nr:heme-binding protein [Roseiarcus fermentans]RBP11316.1 SOUL heme-binding protein [Roseiarcus fermentans]
MRRFASIAIAALAIGAAAVGASVKAADEPPYTVVLSDGDFQIRDYPALTIAEVTVRAPRNEAGNAGFRKLAGYIFGGNAEKRKIAMTAPVIEASAGGADDKGRAREAWTIRFVMPQGLTLDRLPKADDPDIRMHETPATRYAALRYSGLAGDDTVAARTRDLQAILKARNLEPTGAPLLAFYDPPWTPWFMRRNEILIPIR